MLLLLPILMLLSCATKDEKIMKYQSELTIKQIVDFVQTYTGE